MRGTKGELVDVADQTRPSTWDVGVGRQMGKYDRSMNEKKRAESKSGNEYAYEPMEIKRGRGKVACRDEGVSSWALKNPS